MINHDEATPITNYDTDLTIRHGSVGYERTIEHVAMKAPASQEDVDHVLAQPIDDDGRSEWVWITLLNGDLILGCFPCGETYEEMAG